MATLVENVLVKYQQPKYTQPNLQYFTYETLKEEIGNDLIFDIECYQNYFLIAFMSFKTGRVTNIELFNNQSTYGRDDIQYLNWILDNFTIIGFNSTNYDTIVLWAFLSGATNNDLYNITHEIIQLGTPKWKLEKEYKFKLRRLNHIDVNQVAPAAPQNLSLKHYAARMHVKRLRNLPFPITDVIDEEKATILRAYCVDDLIDTAHLYRHLEKPISLRKVMSQTYDVDLRSASDAQIAEKVISREIELLTNEKPKPPKIEFGFTFKYNNPEFLRFHTPRLQALHEEILNTTFVVDDNSISIYDNSKIVSAKNKWNAKVGNTTFTLGIGGIHSTESKQTYYTNDKYILFDRDVSSYYPNIVLNQGLCPQHIGKPFLDIYSKLVTERLTAKEKGEISKAETLKICINGAFGKFGNKYSCIYSPQLLIQVTITGQLALLMLIEMLDFYQIPVISANTDGIVIRCPRERVRDYLTTVSAWEGITGFKTDETRYKSIHSRDVNSYIAVTENKKYKAKGYYTNDWSFKDKNKECLTSNPNATIISKAVMAFLAKDIPLEKTIKNCKDITEFLFIRKVNKGAIKDQTFLGKVVRWYIKYNEFGNIQTAQVDKAGKISMVAESVGSYPLMEIPETFPNDIDYDWYIRKAETTLKDVGYYTQEEQLELF